MVVFDLSQECVILNPKSPMIDIYPNSSILPPPRTSPAGGWETQCRSFLLSFAWHISWIVFTFKIRKRVRGLGSVLFDSWFRPRTRDAEPTAGWIPGNEEDNSGETRRNVSVSDGELWMPVRSGSG